MDSDGSGCLYRLLRLLPVGSHTPLTCPVLVSATHITPGHYHCYILPCYWLRLVWTCICMGMTTYSHLTCNTAAAASRAHPAIYAHCYYVTVLRGHIAATGACYYLATAYPPPSMPCRADLSHLLPVWVHCPTCRSSLCTLRARSSALTRGSLSQRPHRLPAAFYLPPLWTAATCRLLHGL